MCCSYILLKDKFINLNSYLKKVLQSWKLMNQVYNVSAYIKNNLKKN
jgi:hypothetical protein